MTIPNWTSDGLLPTGCHPAELQEVYERFVVGAPNREHRELLFGALSTYLGLLRILIPSGVAWIDGGFSTLKEAPPSDIDVVVHPASWESLDLLSRKQQEQLFGLLTLQDV